MPPHARRSGPRATISGWVRLSWGPDSAARLLAPEDFGVVAFALAYVVYVEAVSDLGTRRR